MAPELAQMDEDLLLGQEEGFPLGQLLGKEEDLILLLGQEKDLLLGQEDLPGIPQRRPAPPAIQN